MEEKQKIGKCREEVVWCREEVVWCSDYYSEHCPKICKYARENKYEEYRHNVIMEGMIGWGI